MNSPTCRAGNSASRSVGYQVQAACHYVSLALNPGTVPQGGQTTVTATVRACASIPQTIVVRFTLAGPLGGSCSTSSSVMFTTPPFTLPPGHSPSEAAQIMTERRFRHIPVVDGDQLVGIVSIRDLVGAGLQMPVDDAHHGSDFP